jgi:hypothetical protein
MRKESSREYLVLSTMIVLERRYIPQTCRRFTVTAAAIKLEEKADYNQML